jgi:hypothetical protein
VLDREGNLAVGTSLTEAEKKRLAIYQTPEGYTYSPATMIAGIVTFYHHNNALPTDAVSRVPDWCTAAGVEDWSTMTSSEKFSCFANIVDPITNKVIADYVNPEWTALGIHVEEVAKPYWDDYMPGASAMTLPTYDGANVSPSGGPAVQHMLRFVFYGEAPGTVLFEKVQVL